MSHSYSDRQKVSNKLKEGGVEYNPLNLFDGLVDAIVIRKWRKVEKWQKNSSMPEEMLDQDPSPVTDLDDANIVTSEADSGLDIPFHSLVLDLDIPHVYVPSSTGGHGHLFLDTYLDQDKFEKLIKMLAECGIIEDGYADASLKRGYSAVRLPWIKKSYSESDPEIDPWGEPDEDSREESMA